MLQDSPAFSGFSVNDVFAAQTFYGNTLGLSIEDTGMGLRLKLKGGTVVFIYAKPDHIPAEFTILNFVVDDIDVAVNELVAKGIVLEKYDSMMHQDEKGIARGKDVNMGPNIAWFKDPAGNILSVLEN